MPISSTNHPPKLAITQAPLTKFQRFSVAFCVFLALLFDGVELGLMPIASLSVTRDLLKSNYSPQIGADWFAWLTASLMMGAAIGGIAFGRMGDKAGRVQALAASVLFYSIFAGLGGLATSLNQLLFFLALLYIIHLIIIFAIPGRSWSGRSLAQWNCTRRRMLDRPFQTIPFRIFRLRNQCRNSRPLASGPITSHHTRFMAMAVSMLRSTRFARPFHSQIPAGITAVDPNTIQCNHFPLAHPTG